MSSAIELWDAVAKPPPSTLTKIKGGRIAGMTDVKPQWRYLAMTETYGLCGIGWKFTVDRQWTEPGDKGVTFAFVNVSLYVKVDGEWSAPIPGNGGDQLIQSEKGGLHNNDEAFKMATTDALSTALKMVGVAAEVYLGNWNGSKYASRPTETTAKPGRGASSFGNKPPPVDTFSWPKATPEQRRVFTLGRIKDARDAAKPADGIELLKTIMGKLQAKSSDLTEGGKQEVIDAALEAEKLLQAKP